MPLPLVWLIVPPAALTIPPEKTETPMRSMAWPEIPVTVPLLVMPPRKVGPLIWMPSLVVAFILLAPLIPMPPAMAPLSRIEPLIVLPRSEMPPGVMVPALLILPVTVAFVTVMRVSVTILEQPETAPGPMPVEQGMNADAAGA